MTTMMKGITVQMISTVVDCESQQAWRLWTLRVIQDGIEHHPENG